MHVQEKNTVYAFCDAEWADVHVPVANAKVESLEIPLQYLRVGHEEEEAHQPHASHSNAISASRPLSG